MRGFENPEIDTEKNFSPFFFRRHIPERHPKTIQVAIGISKNGSVLAVWRSVFVLKISDFSKRGSTGGLASAAPAADLAPNQATSPPDSSRGRGKKKFSSKRPSGAEIRPFQSDQCWRKTAFLQSWTIRNLALREYNLEIGGRPRTNSKPYCFLWICTMRFRACLHAVIEPEQSSGGFRSTLSLAGTGCVSMQSWVSRQVVLRRAPDPLALKPFLSRSFVVCSMCWVGIWVRGVVKSSRSMRPRFDIYDFFQVAQSCILGGIWTCRGVKPWDQAGNIP